MTARSYGGSGTSSGWQRFDIWAHDSLPFLRIAVAFDTRCQVIPFRTSGQSEKTDVKHLLLKRPIEIARIVPSRIEANTSRPSG